MVKKMIITCHRYYCSDTVMDRFVRMNDLEGLTRYMSRTDTAGFQPTRERKFTSRRSQYRPPTRFLRNASSGTETSFKLPQPSKEQRKICTTVAKGYNVAVDSVFGSGKTTSILHICQQSQGKRVLVLTYNSKLKQETRNKVDKLGLSQVQVHSYHAFGVRYYRSDCVTDYEIRQVVASNTSPRHRIQFDVLVMDEQQDMTPLYYQFASKIIRDRTASAPPQLVVFGDVYQNIYAFMGADARFLTWASRLFSGATLGWKNRNINTSFRTTYPVAHFVNQHLVGYDRVQAERDGGPVRYLICDSFGSTPFQEVTSYLEQGYRPEDIYILAPSLRVAKNLSPVRRLENRLVAKGIPCFVPTNDEEDVRDSVTQGKIVFSTFHQVKGSERPVVLVFNIDASYYDYYAKQESRQRCPNTVYVALSRSRERLSVIHHYENDYFPTINRTTLHDDPRIDVCTTKPITHKYRSERESGRELKTPIGNLLRHLDISTIQTALSYLDYRIVREGLPVLRIPGVVEMDKGQSEAVSDITGVAIPTAYELSQTGGSSVLRYIHQESERLAPDHYQRVGKIGSQLQRDRHLSPEQLLYLANVYLSVSTGWTSKLQQITNYHWLPPDQLATACTRLNQLVAGNSQATATKQFTLPVARSILGRELIGEIDLVVGDTCYELRCTHTLDSEHLLRLAILAWCNYATSGRSQLIIYNISNGERAEIKFTDRIADLVYYLVDHKYKPVRTLSDTEFLTEIQQLPRSQVKSEESSSGCLL